MDSFPKTANSVYPTDKAPSVATRVLQEIRVVRVLLFQVPATLLVKLRFTIEFEAYTKKQSRCHSLYARSVIS